MTEIEGLRQIQYEYYGHINNAQTFFIESKSSFQKISVFNFENDLLYSVMLG